MKESMIVKFIYFYIPAVLNNARSIVVYNQRCAESIFDLMHALKYICIRYLRNSVPQEVKADNQQKLLEIKECMKLIGFSQNVSSLIFS